MGLYKVARSNTVSYFPNRITIFSVEEPGVDSLHTTLDIVIPRGGLKVSMYCKGYEIGEKKVDPIPFLIESRRNWELYDAFAFLAESIGYRDDNTGKIYINSSDNKAMIITEFYNMLKVELARGKSNEIVLNSRELYSKKLRGLDAEVGVPQEVLEDFECMIINSGNSDYYETRKSFFESLQKARVKERE